MGKIGAKLIVAKGFKKLPKVRNIAQSGHTDSQSEYTNSAWRTFMVEIVFIGAVPHWVIFEIFR